MSGKKKNTVNDWGSYSKGGLGCLDCQSCWRSSSTTKQLRHTGQNNVMLKINSNHINCSDLWWAVAWREWWEALVWQMSVGMLDGSWTDPVKQSHCSEIYHHCVKWIHHSSGWGAVLLNPHWTLVTSWRGNNFDFFYYWRHFKVSVRHDLPSGFQIHCKTSWTCWEVSVNIHGLGR